MPNSCWALNRIKAETAKGQSRHRRKGEAGNPWAPIKREDRHRRALRTREVGGCAQPKHQGPVASVAVCHQRFTGNSSPLVSGAPRWDISGAWPNSRCTRRRGSPSLFQAFLSGEGDLVSLGAPKHRTMSMNEDEARRRLAKCLQLLRGDIGYAPPESWSSDRLELRQLPSGDWLAAQPELPSEGILLKSDGAWFPFFGALGKAVPLLGLPASREYFLASTKLGRYQVYERGLAVWETFRKGGEIGYPVVTWESVGQRARTCRALIAFFDLRNFTKWSDSPEVDANGIQDVIEKMEHSFQEAFSRPWCQSLFAKGTGDGFMVVSEAGWHAVGGGATETSFQAGHTKAFCRACAETVQRARKIIPEEARHRLRYHHRTSHSAIFARTSRLHWSTGKRSFEDPGDRVQRTLHER